MAASATALRSLWIIHACCTILLVNFIEIRILGEEKQFMAIRAVIFDLGGVLIEIDWDRYKEDERLGALKEHLYSYEKLNAELAQFIGRLRSFYKIATICNGGSREAMNRKFRLSERVDLMVFDGEEGTAKPAARIYQRTLTRLGVQPDETVFVDNQENNVDAAQQLGIHSIHFKNTAQAIADIQALLQR
jgi:FMN phosphatase YigB (HAD superfamily)